MKLCNAPCLPFSSVMKEGGVGVALGSVDGDLVLVRLVGTLLLSELEAIDETGTLLSIGPCCTGVEVGIDDVEVGDGTGKAVVFATPTCMYVGVCGGEGRGIEPNFNYKSCEVVCSGGGGWC